MDPTTADFNAWLAEEGAKVGATVPPQPGNLLAMYGTGYAPGDTAYEPTTADILSRAQARDAGFPGFLRRVSEAIPESGRHLDPRGQDESLLAYWKRAADALSIHDMAKGGLNTAANWLQGTPEIGPDTLAPLGLAPMGGLVGRTTAAVRPTVGDVAMSRYLEWKHPNETAVTGGGMGRNATMLEEVRRGDSLHVNPMDNYYRSSEGLANENRLTDARAKGRYGGDAMEIISRAETHGADDLANENAKMMHPATHPTGPIRRGGEPLILANDYNQPLGPQARAYLDAVIKQRSEMGLDLLSDQSRASVPGTVVNAQEDDEDKKKRKK